MRLCVITDEISQDLGEVLDLCDEHGFKAIEIRSVWGTPPDKLTLRQCEQIADRAAARGVEVAAFASPVFKTAMPAGATDLARARSTLERALEQCAALRTALLRVFSFYRSGPPDVAGATLAIDAILDQVATPGITLGLETGTRTNTPMAAHAQSLLTALARPGTGMVWDPGNTVFAGFGGGHLGGLEDVCVQDLVHVHVKNPLGQTGYVELGRGSLRWPSILAALGERGYCGYLSLETHWRRERVLTAAERDEPWGWGFSAGGLEASAPCMASLASWVAAAA
jgi:sugar phosphate isomerase/epimerase